MSEFRGSVFKENQGECGCGCGEFGTLKKPNRKGVQCVARKCKCVTCRNRQNRKRGLSKQTAAAKRLHLAMGMKFLPSNEESFAGPLRWEHKATKAEAGPVWTAYRKVEAQSEASRPIGDHRPFIAVFTPPGENHDGLVVVRQTQLLNVAIALLEQEAAS